MNLISTLWKNHLGRIYIGQIQKTGNYEAVDQDGKSMGLGKPQKTIADLQIMFQQLWEQDMIESILDQDEYYIKNMLNDEPDFTDGDGNTWRFAVLEMRIKTQSKTDFGGHGWKLFKKYEDIRKMAGDWNRLKFRIEADVLPPVEVLPPANTLPAVQVDHTPEAVMSQYKRAISGTLEIIRFGAMLIEIEGCLTRETTSKSRHDPSGEGPSIKKWMDQNCPEINYKTAIRYKTLAQGLQDMFHIPAKLPLTLALPASDGSANVYVPDNINVSAAKVEQIQMQVWEMVNGKSARQLMFDFALSDPKERGGAHHKAKNLTSEEKYRMQVEAADQLWAKYADDLVDQIRRTKTHLMLSANRIDQVMVQLDAVRDALKLARRQS